MALRRLPQAGFGRTPTTSDLTVRGCGILEPKPPVLVKLSAVRKGGDVSMDVRSQLRRRDTIFLIVVAAVSFAASALSFYVGHQQKAAIVATAEGDAPRVPVPAGPRKYQ